LFATNRQIFLYFRQINDGNNSVKLKAESSKLKVKKSFVRKEMKFKMMILEDWHFIIKKALRLEPFTLPAYLFYSLFCFELSVFSLFD
jgi:hypothetical protein